MTDIQDDGAIETRFIVTTIYNDPLCKDALDSGFTLVKELPRPDLARCPTEFIFQRARND